MLRHIIAGCIILAGFSSFGQDRDRARTQEYLQQQEQAKRAATMREYDSAVHLMEEGRYEQADEKFRYVLANLRSIPSDLTFHFGKNSFHLARYQQSIDWLNKYIQLKGTNGQFSAEAVNLKRRAEEEFLQQKKQQSQNVEQIFSTNYDLDCGPSGKVVCPACRGDHVIIKKGTFSNEYRTCPYCNEQGLLTCDEYNLMIRGELQPRQ
jgi:tetratricopeptide (TPR) repeat protein